LSVRLTSRTARRPGSCPNSGKELALGASMPHHDQMPTADCGYLSTDAELVGKVAASAGLSAGEAARVVADVVAWYREPVEAYVRRRHAHHRVYGKRNAEIFALIAAELAERVVAAPELSQRQLRRIIYG